jgi:hypothetical protein
MAQLPDATKRRALGLLAGGMTAASVAREVDLSHKTILRWRDAAADAITDDPAERAAIHALTATLPDGSPDHPTRLSAARLLGVTKPIKPLTDPNAVVHVTVTQDREAGTVTVVGPDGQTSTAPYPADGDLPPTLAIAANRLHIFFDEPAVLTG